MGHSKKKKNNKQHKHQLMRHCQTHKYQQNNKKRFLHKESQLPIFLHHPLLKHSRMLQIRAVWLWKKINNRSVFFLVFHFFLFYFFFFVCVCLSSNFEELFLFNVLPFFFSISFKNITLFILFSNFREILQVILLLKLLPWKRRTKLSLSS